MSLTKIAAAIALCVAFVSQVQAGRPAPTHLIFVTSSVHGISTVPGIPPAYPDFNTSEGADWIGTLAAFNAGLFVDWNGFDTPWTAVLSTDLADARARIAIRGPVYNRLGEIVAMNEADFFDGSLLAPIRYDEFGNDIGDDLVWTGSTGRGRRAATASGWTDPSPTSFARIGRTTATDSEFLSDGLLTANGVARLYVIGPAEGLFVPEPAGGVLALIGLLSVALRRRLRDRY